MAVDNEVLMQQLQRVGVLSRRGRHIPHEGHEHHGHGHGPIGKGEGKGGGHRGARNGLAFGDPEAAHGYGNHKCHGGSGRHGQNRILALLTMQEGVSQKDLAYLLGIRPQSLSEALAKLEEDGMITRKHNEEDQRVVNVFLTDAGRGRAEKVAEDRKKSASDIFSVLTEEEKEQLSAILDKLVGGLDEQLAEKKRHHHID